jgi:hypothetical protein
MARFSKVESRATRKHRSRKTSSSMSRPQPARGSPPSARGQTSHHSLSHRGDVGGDASSRKHPEKKKKKKKRAPEEGKHEEKKATAVVALSDAGDADLPADAKSLLDEVMAGTPRARGATAVESPALEAVDVADAPGSARTTSSEATTTNTSATDRSNASADHDALPRHLSLTEMLHADVLAADQDDGHDGCPAAAAILTPGRAMV